MLIVDFFVAGAVAVLSGLGVGSGGLLVIYLTLIRGVEQHAAQGINLLFFIFAAGASMLVHKKKRKINYGVLLSLLIFGIFGALLGGALAGVSDPSVMRRCFGIFLIFSGGITMLRSFCRKSGNTCVKKGKTAINKERKRGD